MLQGLKFCLVGAANTIIDFIIYYLLTRYTDFFGAHFLIANTISFCAGTTFGFFAHRTWTFSQKHKPTMVEATKFYATTICALGLSQVLLFYLVQWMGLHDLAAKVFITLFVGTCVFMVKKFFVFKPELVSEL